MENNLTPQQQQAVENRGGKLLVSAAAGSGKTKVLVDRLLLYIMDPVSPCNIDDFLIITYTKAAATELRGKIAAKLSEHLAENPENHHLQHQMQRLYLAKISTVHSFCTDLLREYAYELDVAGDFRVGDENECGQLRAVAMEETLEEAYTTQKDPDCEFRVFIDSQGLGRTDRMVPEIVQKVHDSARCHLNPEEWLDHCIAMAELTDKEDAAETVWGEFLLADLKGYLESQIGAMKACVRMAAQDGNMEKPETLLRAAVVQMEYLAAAKTWDEVLERRDINFGTLRFTKKADPDTAECIKAVRQNCKEGLEKKLKVFCDPSAQVMADLRQTSAAVRGLVALARDFGLRYRSQKRRRRVLDFSDLEHYALDLLTGKTRGEPTRIAREVGRRFREVLVDEYQDSNAVQDKIFEALTRERNNCFMVGDVKQSIYQFRLADPTIFLKKYEAYAPAGKEAPGEGRKVILSSNFRSGGAVLEAANDVFRRCMSKEVGGLDYGDDEALREGVDHTPLGDPEVELYVLEAGDDTYGREAAFVADRIVELLDGKHMVRGKEGLRPIEPEDIAILLRSPGSVGQVYQDALSARGVRSAFGSGRNLLETGEISLVRSLLQIISNPHQDIPLLAVLASPVFCFTADDLARIRAGSRSTDFYEALLLDDTNQSRAFVATLETLRELSRTVNLAQLLEQIFCMTRLDSIYAAMESGVERSANLREFYRVTMEFEATARRDLSQFLEHLELLEEKGLTMSDTAPGGAVNILSIHKSKGLEYPVVILAALSRSFNKEDLRAQVLCDGDLGQGLSAVDQTTRVRYPTISKYAIVAKTARESLSEEMRVLYVAMTRARDRLIMTYTDKSPEKELAKIARCLEPCGSRLLAGEVKCPGQWVLMEAMCRTEAGQLFALAEAQPDCTRARPMPWKIRAVTKPVEAEDGTMLPQAVTPNRMPEGSVETLKRHLSFRYHKPQAAQTPSKQTATQIKGREKDQEIASDSRPEPVNRVWRTLESHADRGKAYGTAMHTLMQYLRFDRCTTADGLEEEIARLTKNGFFTEEEAASLDRDGILAFFATALGQKLITGQTLREFKFSILEDASSYGPGLEGEQILLQGVVDCALVEEDGITIVDFKTDYVTEKTLPQVAERYRAQVAVYADALSRIYELPVKARFLWMFHLRRLVNV